MKKLIALVVVLAFVGLTPGCAAFSKTSSTVTPEQNQTKLEQIKKTADIINRAGLIVEQALKIEKQLADVNVVKPAIHQQVNTYVNTFAKHVLQTLTVLDTLTATDIERRAAVQSLIDAAHAGISVHFPDAEPTTRISTIFGILELILQPALAFLP
jgi:hypothetical protein